MIYFFNPASGVHTAKLQMVIICETAFEYAKVLKKTDSNEYGTWEWDTKLDEWEKMQCGKHAQIETLTGWSNMGVMITFHEYTEKLREELFAYFIGD